MFKLPSAGTEPGTLDSARKAMMPSIAKRPLLISVRNLESHGKSTIRRNGKDSCTANDDGSPRKRRAESEQRQSLSLRKNTCLRRHPRRDFSAFHSSDLFFCKLKGSKSSNGIGCGISFFRDGNAPGLPPRM